MKVEIEKTEGSQPSYLSGFQFTKLTGQIKALPSV